MKQNLLYASQQLFVKKAGILLLALEYLLLQSVLCILQSSSTTTSQSLLEYAQFQSMHTPAVVCTLCILLRGVLLLYQYYDVHIMHTSQQSRSKIGVCILLQYQYILVCILASMYAYFQVLSRYFRAWILRCHACMHDKRNI